MARREKLGTAEGEPGMVRRDISTSNGVQVCPLVPVLAYGTKGLPSAFIISAGWVILQSALRSSINYNAYTAPTFIQVETLDAMEVPEGGLSGKSPFKPRTRFWRVRPRTLVYFHRFFLT